LLLRYRWLRDFRWSRNWCLAASAALGRVTLALSAFADDICDLIQVRQRGEGEGRGGEALGG